MITYFSDVPPFSPCTPMDFCFFKKYPVRRALLELGTNDPKLNMRMAESLLTISTEKFMAKWNFDPISMKPKEGKYSWTPVKRETVVRNNKSSFTVESAPVSTHLATRQLHCDRVPHPEDISEVKPAAVQSNVTTTSTRPDVKEPTEDLLTTLPPQITDRLLSPRSDLRRVTPSSCSSSKSPSNSSCLQSRQPTTPKSRQSKITEYGRERKRLYSKSEDDDFSPRKKLLLDTPSKVTSSTVSVVLE